MKRVVALLLCVGLLIESSAQELEKTTSYLSWDGGADLRIRQEAHENVPQVGVWVPQAARGAISDYQSYLRIRPRVWGEVKSEDFKLYLRLADEFRHYFRPRHSRAGQFPDELIVDNLYFDLYDLLGGVLDLRVGRQDFLGPTGPTYGAGRVLLDGNSGDGSRTVFMDAIKATIKFDDKNALDILGIYNKSESELGWGRPKNAAGRHIKGKQLTYNYPGATDMDEYGGGLYFKSREFAELPFELYYLYKRETKAKIAKASIPGRKIHTLGTRLMPTLTDTLSMELESAAQAGEKDGDKNLQGYMGYAGITYKPLFESIKPFGTLAIYYLSGDRNRGDESDEKAWNPLWARWPQYSEMQPYANAGTAYWSNLIYPSLTLGTLFPDNHKLIFNTGPAFAAVEDGLGGGNGDYYGWFGMIRYDFPLWRKIFGKRGDITGHLTLELLEPGSYFVENRTAYFARWEVIAKF